MNNIVTGADELLPPITNDTTIFIQCGVKLPVTAQFNPILRHGSRNGEKAAAPWFPGASRRFSIMHSHILPGCLVAFGDERDDSCWTAFTRLTIIQRHDLYVKDCAANVRILEYDYYYCLYVYPDFERRNLEFLLEVPERLNRKIMVYLIEQLYLLIIFKRSFYVYLLRKFRGGKGIDPNLTFLPIGWKWKKEPVKKPFKWRMEIR